jgi:hypothetical protein
MIAESSASFIACWKQFSPRLPGGEYRELPGLTAVWGDVALPFCNALLLSSPVKDCAGLRSRVDILQSYVATRTRPPMLLLCRDWLPAAVQPIANDIIAPTGLIPLISLRGMSAGHIRPPVRRLPRLTYRRVADAQTRTLISDINSLAYGFPVEYGREAFMVPEAWDENSFGYIGFHHGRPVAAAAAFKQAGALYVGFVATLPEEQCHGYAEAVMRHSLKKASEATGMYRSLLHATDAGHPIYLRMGYRETTTFTGFLRDS